MDCVDGEINTHLRSSSEVACPIRKGLSYVSDNIFTGEACHSHDGFPCGKLLFDEKESSKKTLDSGICLSACSTASCDSGVCHSDMSNQDKSTLSSDVCQVEARVQRLNIVQENRCQHEHLPVMTQEHDTLWANTVDAPSHDLPRSNQCRRDTHHEWPRVFQQDADGDTTLHIAIINKLSDYSLHLINQSEAPACLNVENHRKQTPLHLAVMTHQVSIVRSLVEAGVDLHRGDHNGNTPLHHACRLADIDCVKALIRPTDPLRPYVQQKNYEGDTCLHLAAAVHQADIIVYLAALCRFNVNVQEGRSGRAILHQAVECEDTMVIKALLRVAHIDVNTRTFAGYTALDLAYGRGFHGIQNMLIAAGAHTNRYHSDSESESDSDCSMNDFD